MTKPLNDLNKGLEIIEPFLKKHDFELHNCQNFKGIRNQFTFTFYKNKRKQFILGYDYSIGHVVYQCDDLAVSHDFYLDKLGFGHSKNFKDIQTKDKLLGFTHILQDFKYLVDDFFKGECIRLKEIAALQDNIIKEYDHKAREGYNIEFDKLRILKARQEFKNKDFKKTIEIYNSIEYLNQINDLDKNIIAYCKGQNKAK